MCVGGGRGIVVFFQDTLSFSEGSFFSGSNGIRFKQDLSLEINILSSLD